MYLDDPKNDICVTAIVLTYTGVYHSVSGDWVIWALPSPQSKGVLGLPGEQLNILICTGGTLCIKIE